MRLRGYVDFLGGRVVTQIKEKQWIESRLGREAVTGDEGPRKGDGKTACDEMETVVAIEPWTKELWR